MWGRVPGNAPHKHQYITDAYIGVPQWGYITVLTYPSVTHKLAEALLTLHTRVHMLEGVHTHTHARMQAEPAAFSSGPGSSGSPI